MTPLQSILLGILQGLTEFIPISSSAHLALLPYFVNWRVSSEIEFIFDILVQFATLGAVLVYYWSDLKQMFCSLLRNLLGNRDWSHPDSRLAFAVLVGTLPVVVLGYPLKGLVQEAFKQPLWIGCALLFTSMLLYTSEKRHRAGISTRPLTLLDALLIGLWQTLAVFPGISRSGATIAGGLFRNLDRQQATRFSFLLSIPALAGAGIVSLVDFIQLPNSLQYLPIILPGLLTAFVVGYLSIFWLVRYVQNHSLSLFAYYCFVLGV
ncbi:MAG: undecaprenyl-diphosphate phosphatase, partial [Anaerolineales bacterium]|nr:undecaprenyl-diphosphate phosphatase [Anaerolineales bacterium]MDW8446781.1 undecaprenyl-diphosphate phosphatase [Anaerolineales bacterium]